MSKTTKIIAALGVVAGLGVAALPAFTYADHSVEGNVDLYVQIPEAIAMSITGNNDDDSIISTTVSGDAAHGAVDVYSGDSTTATDLTAGTVDGHTVTASTTTHSSTAVKTTQNALVEGSLNATSKLGEVFASNITVWTNATGGYKLEVKSVGTDAALHNGSNYSIPDQAGTLAQGTAGWGYKVVKYTNGTKNVDDEDTDAAQVTDTTYSAMTTGDVKIDELDKATSAGRSTVVLYGVATDTDQAAGLYKATVLYTATTQNS